MQPCLVDSVTKIHKDFAIYVLDCLRAKQRPTLAGHHISPGYLAAAVRFYAHHRSDPTSENCGMMSKPEMKALARTIEVIDYPNLERMEWICAAASIFFYEHWLSKEERRLEEVAKNERAALLSEVGYEVDSQMEFGLTKPV